MTFHKYGSPALVLLLTFLLSVFGPVPAIARNHQRLSKRSHQHSSALRASAKLSVKKRAAHHGRRKRVRRHRRNVVPNAGRYLAQARRNPLSVGDVQRGTGSWYGARYHGRRTSSGETFNKEALTAAHLSLPFGTYVQVRNLDNDSTVVVRITDRGPFGKGRVIDVSEAAARELNIFSKGVCRVAVEVLPSLETLPCFDDADLPQLTPIALELAQPDHYYFLQVGAYAELARAEALVSSLLHEQPDMPVIVSDVTENGQLMHRVLMGRFIDRIEATLIQNRLRATGLRADVREMVLAEG